MSGKTGKVRAANPFIPAYYILKRRAGQKILLLQPETFACVCTVVWIKYSRDILYRVLLAYGQRVLLVVKQVEIKFFNGFALPKAQGAYMLSFIAHDRHIIRYGKHLLVIKADDNRLIVPPFAPRVAKALPVVRLFHLKPVL